MTKVRILIADDHNLIREGLIGSLKVNTNYIVVGEASNGFEAVQKTEELSPDIILMDISMPGMNGLKATKNILKNHPEIKILVLSAHDDREYIEEFIRSGAKGYILKTTSSKELVKAIENVISGKVYIDPAISQAICEEIVNITASNNVPRHDLTDREIEVLTMISKGLMNKEIAGKLGISIKTIIAHRDNIRAKLNIHTIAELTKYAIERGYVKINVY